MSGILFKKPNNEESKEIEETKVTDIDKLKIYIRKKGNQIMYSLIGVVDSKFVEGVTDYNKCIEYINFCIGNEKFLLESSVIKLDYIYDLFMNFEDKNIICNLINMILRDDSSVIFLDYMLKSRAYFTDCETWASRIYEVVNEKIDRDKALKEDKMRLGIYTNISDKTMNDLNKRLDSIKILVNSLNSDIENNEKYIDSVNFELREKSQKLIDNINSTFKSSITELKAFTDASLESIKRILNLNPSSREEILKELEKQFNLIEAFDESISIKERYDKLVSLKNDGIMYHPKFDEILKYFLAGNTVCLTGPSKCGKTTIAKQLADLVGLPFYNLGEIHDEVVGINGYYDFNTNYNKPLFQKCFENGSVALIKNVDNAPLEVHHSLNNIISNFKYNPYVFGNKSITTPHPNFRLIMTNNNNLNLDSFNIDNLVTININYDENFENSLSNDERLNYFLHELRKKGINITTNTFINITKHLDLGLIDIEELLINYIIQNNSTDLLKRISEEIDSDNKYNNVLKKILKG